MPEARIGKPYTWMIKNRSWSVDGVLIAPEGCAMAQRTVSPRVFHIVFLIVLCLLMPLLFRLLPTLDYVPIVSGLAAIFLLAYLVARTGPRLLGFQVRKRCVERLIAAIEADDDDEAMIDLPIQVPYRRSFRILMLTTELFCLAMGLIYFWDPFSLRDNVALFGILVPIGGAVCILIGILGIALFFRLRIVCEITSGGMNAHRCRRVRLQDICTLERTCRMRVHPRRRGLPGQPFRAAGPVRPPAIPGKPPWLICATPADRAGSSAHSGRGFL